MGLGKFSRREVRARPMRVFLTFASITIGVGAVVSVLLATNTTRQAQAQMLKAVSGKSDLEIVSDASGGFSYELVAQVRETEGVKTAAPSLNRFAVLFAGEEKARTQVLGIDPRIDQQVRDFELVDGKLPTAYDEMLLDSSFAQSLGVETDSTVRILARGGLEEFRVVGLVRPAGTAVALGSAAYLVLPAAQQAFGAGANIDQIQLVLEEGVSASDVREQLLAVLPQGVTVRVPRTSSDMAKEALFATENGLYMAIAFALLISAFIIYNTFQMAVGERRKQLGILRAIGATRGQVAWMILREALVISSLASVTGCVLGVWGARYLNSATEHLLQVSLPGSQLTVWPFIVAVLLGIVVSMLGALMPARRASQVEPVEAMRAIEIHHNDEVIRRTTPLGLAVIPVGALLLILAIYDHLPLGGDVTGIVLMLLGCVLLIPVLLNRVASWLVALVQPIVGVEAKLAQKQLTRNVGRTALTIGVLFIAISTSTGMAGNVLDNVQNVRDWYSQTIIGDFFIRASLPDLATGASADMSDEIGDQLAKIEGIEVIDPMRFVSVQSGELSVLLVVRSFIGEDKQFFDLVEGNRSDVVGGLHQGKAVVGTVLAQRMQLTVGDELPLETGRGTVQLEVVGVANDYFGGGLTVHLERTHAARLLGVDGVDAYVIQADDEQLGHVEQQLKEFALANGLIFQSYAELVRFIDGMINGVIASLWSLLALGCIIAAIGLVNTLTMNILEQTREIGMLRVVAMTRGQVRRMIFAQAALLGVMGLVPGALAGILVTYAISLSSVAVLGHDILFHFRPGLMAGCLAFGLLIVLAASLIPAERAARLQLSSALHYE